MDSFPAPRGLVPLANLDNDRIYLVTETGLVQCLHDADLPDPIYYGADRPAEKKEETHKPAAHKPAEHKPTPPKTPGDEKPRPPRKTKPKKEKECRRRSGRRRPASQRRTATRQRRRWSGRCERARPLRRGWEVVLTALRVFR